ncbi:unnamed protein product [Lactuca saligna]|uniref:Uncharacterized protein n=1 Tax=Lactuca saligna TaxID=75948 RepID=A0AA35ZBK8_LACSI|nr:unnamed protein product [Lactuca saligna]
MVQTVNKANNQSDHSSQSVSTSRHSQSTGDEGGVHASWELTMSIPLSTLLNTVFFHTIFTYNADLDAKFADHVSINNSESEVLSKNARKKELKNKEKEEKRRLKNHEKEKKAAAMPKSQVQKQSTADDEDVDPTQFLENRLKTLAVQKATGLNPYPHKFHVSMSIIEFINKYESLNSGEYVEDVQVSLSG